MDKKANLKVKSFKIADGSDSMVNKLKEENV